MSGIFLKNYFIGCREGDVRLENNVPEVYKGGIWDPPCPECSKLTCLGIKMFCKRLGYESGVNYQDNIIDNIEEAEKNDTSGEVRSVSEYNESDASIIENCLGGDSWPLCTKSFDTNENETTQSCTQASIQKIKCMNSTSFIENLKSSC